MSSRILNKMKNIFTFILSLVLFCSFIAGQGAYTGYAAEEDANVFNIKNEDDFETFIELCAKNGWSKGKTINLLTDIGEKKENNYIAKIVSFGGTFNGNGHTIYNLCFSTVGEISGLFNYVESGAVIENLTVVEKVSIDMEFIEYCNKIHGVIAGVNAGTIKNCTVKGTVYGNGVVGAVAGQNGASGNIIECINEAYVEAVSSVGGIVGINFGVITKCSNKGEVNTSDNWLDSEENAIDLEIDNIMSSISDKLNAKSDIGGIVGNNNGIVVNCNNEGNVGYRSNGYNVGGISGCTSGNVIDCINKGKINGKENVGGIAGLLVPYTIPKDSESVLKYANILNEQVNTLVEDMNKLVDTSSGEINDLLEHTRNTLEIAELMADDVKHTVDKDIEAVNDLSGRIQYVINALPEILDAVEAATGSIADINKNIADLNTGLSELKLSQADKAQFDTYKNQIRDDVNTLTELLNSIKIKVNEISELISDEENPISILNKIVTEISAFPDEVVSAVQVTVAIATKADKMVAMVEPRISEAGDTISNSVSAITENTDKLLSCVKDIEKKVKSVFTYLSSLDTIRFETLSKDYDTNSSNLKTEVDYLITILFELNNNLSSKSEIIGNDIKAINETVKGISVFFTEKIEDVNGIINGNKIIIDKSLEADNTDKAVRITGCGNENNVYGWKNIGGIVGNSKVNFSTESNTEKGLSIKYYAYAVIESCINEGNIAIKNNNGGGIAGNISNGCISNCFSRGGILGEGKNIGGIAGYSEGYIDKCQSMASILARDNAGGIAGVGINITNCYSFCFLEDYLSNVGAIVGNYITNLSEDLSVVKKEALTHIKNNYYVNEDVEGAYGISKKNCAEKISYEEMIAKKDASEEFKTINVVYLDEEYNVISKTTTEYGSEITEDEVFPVMQADNGKFYTFIVNSHDYVVKNDIMYIGVLFDEKKSIIAERYESEDADEDINKDINKDINGEANAYMKEEKILVPIIEGYFSFFARFYCDEDKDKTMSVDSGKEAVTYHLKIEDNMSTEQTDFNVRIPCKNVKGVKAYSLRNGNWVEIPATENGKYVGVKMQDREDYICIVTNTKTENNYIKFIIIGVVVLVAGVVLVILKNKKREKISKK